MNPLPLPTPEQYATLAHATLIAWRVSHSRTKKATVSGQAQKAVLLAIVAVRGRPVSHKQLGRFAGCCHRGAMRAVTALLEQGLISPRLPLPMPKRPLAYVVEWERVVGMILPESLPDLRAVIPPLQLRRSA